VTRWLTQDEQRAWRGLLEVCSRLDARLNRQLQESSGLSLADYDVLVPLSETPDGRLRMFELSERLAWEQSRLSHHVTRMQRRGLIDREDCRQDRRGAYVVITAAGRDVITRAAPAHADAVRSLVFDAVSPEQVAELDAFTSAVLSRLREDETKR